MSDTTAILTVPADFAAWCNTLPAAARKRLSIHELRQIWEPMCAELEQAQQGKEAAGHELRGGLAVIRDNATPDDYPWPIEWQQIFVKVEQLRAELEQAQKDKEAAERERDDWAGIAAQHGAEKKAAEAKAAEQAERIAELEAAARWIPVSESIPDKEGEYRFGMFDPVLGWVETTGRIAYFEGSLVCPALRPFGPYPAYTHWQHCRGPIPEPTEVDGEAS